MTESSGNEETVEESQRRAEDVRAVLSAFGKRFIPIIMDGLTKIY